MTQDLAVAAEADGFSPEPEYEAPNRPDSVPDKFWDRDAGEVRIDALAKSYSELERKLGGAALTDIPDSPEDYRISLQNAALGTDLDVNARLHEAGFSQGQAQLVYDLAAEHIPALVQDLAAEFEAHRQTERLVDHYGGAERWNQTSRQLSAWGKRHLPPEVYEALSTTVEGVLAMERLMASGEPGLAPSADGHPAGLSEDDLKEMMRDPRYWRERDPATVDKVRQGFRKLFPGKG